MASVPQAAPDPLANVSSRSEHWATSLEALSIPPQLVFGYLGLLLFMMGDGVESGYLAHFLHVEGFSQDKVALLFTIYGAISAMAAWCSGAIADVWSPRLAMFTGFVVWIVFQVIFLGFALPMGSFHLIILSYGIRGLGYPLFAYGFLVLVTNVTPPRRLASAVGWFWFAFSAGLPTLGVFFAILMVPAIGQYATLWCSLLIVIAGGFVALTGIPRKTARPGPVTEKPTFKSMFSGVFSSMSIAWKKPKTAIGCVVRMINTAPQVGFLVFLPTFFTTVVTLRLSEWLQLLTYMFLSNVIAHPLSGIVGDRLGWRQTVVFVGGVGCTITTLLLYYIPVAHRGNFALCALVAMLYGATLAGYVPLTAIMPHLAPENKGAAISMLNLGADAGALLGPAIVAIFLKPLGVEGVMWIFAGLYALSAVLTLFLTLPEEAETGAIR